MLFHNTLVGIREALIAIIILAICGTLVTVKKLTAEQFRSVLKAMVVLVVAVLAVSYAADKTLP